MDSRAQQLVNSLKLTPHPEGGWYREVYRSPLDVAPHDTRSPRSALTSIYFLIESGQFSRWHKVLSDEVWIHLEGAPLELWEWDAETSEALCTTLGPLDFSADIKPQHVIPAGIWQAARPRHASSASFTLVTCVVAPGFDFTDFSMMDPAGLEARQIGRDWPDLACLV
ncbi:MAG: cupin domain-containing protein [Pseudomonadota bacterium]